MQCQKLINQMRLIYQNIFIVYFERNQIALIFNIKVIAALKHQNKDEYIYIMPKHHKAFQQLDQAPLTQSYSAKPVQNYGLSLLKGMGFTEERGIGFNKQNALSQPLVLKPRPKSLGLGAKPEDAVQERPLYSKQDFVVIKTQPHKGMIGVIKRVNKQEQVLVIELGISGSQVRQKASQVYKITEQKYKQLRLEIIRENSQAKEQKSQKKKRRLKWVIPNIRCKVVDKLSPYYLKKVVVNQLLSQRQFQCIHFSQTGQKVYLREINEKQLQTVLPKSQTAVLILDNKFKGQKANLISRNRQKAQVLVQILQTLQIRRFNQDAIAQFVQL